jgi:peptide deformylase
LGELRRDPQVAPQEKRQRFEDFDARVIQHEYDHLEGILFTDHILRHDLPLYIDENDQLVQVSNKKEVIKLLG